VNPLSLASESNPKDLDEKIFVEQIHVLYRPSVPTIIASMVVGLALLLGFWDLISHLILIIWFSLMLLVLGARYVTCLQYRKIFNSENAKRFAVYYVVGAGLTGLLWGVSGVLLFPPGETAYQLFLVITLVGLGAGSVTTHSAYLPTVFSFFPVSMLPIIGMLFYTAETIHVSLGIMLIAYLLSLSYFAVTSNRGLKETLKLRFENIDLVAQLQEQKGEAEQANIAKSKFLAAASHDLRQPLYALSLFTAVLDESIESPKVRRVVDQIKASVDALQNLFNALLDISRLDAGVIQVEKSDFYLQPLLDKLANDFDPLAREKGLRIDCPACDSAVRSDLALLEQILRNYISNAIRYSESGEIRVTCIADDGNVTINVIDKGLGIAEENQQIIFSEFHQLSNPERDRSKGLGLGLAIVKRTAKLLGHSINVESKPGKGSEFSISVPQAHSVEEAIADDADANQDAQYVGSELIVVIDDEASIRDGMQTLLKQWGYEVISAADKDEVINLLGQQSRIPDGIIADYRLREHKTGIEVIKAIHTEYEKSIPALIVTGDTSVDELREVDSSGFEVLHKPVAPIKLRAFLRHIHVQKE